MMEVVHEFMNTHNARCRRMDGAHRHNVRFKTERFCLREHRKVHAVQAAVGENRIELLEIGFVGSGDDFAAFPVRNPLFAAQFVKPVPPFRTQQRFERTGQPRDDS